MDVDEGASLRSLIATFDESHYRFVDFGSLGDFGEPVRTADASDRYERLANRHEQRYRYFFQRLLEVTGGSLRGHRILDLGCNAGFWSLKAIQAEADFVFGIDGRQLHVDHANLVFEAAGVDRNRYRFEAGNFLEYPFGQGDLGYDIVLCLGVLYHVAKPVELFEVMSRAGADVIVIDTEVSLAPGSMFQVYREPTESPTNAVDYETVFYPTRQAIVDLAGQFGYKAVPLALNVTDWRGMDNYREHRRVAFICARSAPLESLRREILPLAARTGMLAEAARLAYQVRRRASRLSGRLR
jgi:tRNA (mo5U34)-methyltransferase